MKYRQEAVRIRAYHIWEREGCPQGRQQEHWMRAERELAYLAVERGDAGAIRPGAPEIEEKPSKPARRKQVTATGKGARKTRAKAKAEESV